MFFNCFSGNEKTRTKDDGANVWLPEVTVKFIPKIPLTYAALKGTFIDLKDNSALGGSALANTMDLEPDIVYTLSMHSSQGWTAGGYARNVKITPKFELTSYKTSPSVELNITLNPITKINSAECGD